MAIATIIARICENIGLASSSYNVRYIHNGIRDFRDPASMLYSADDSSTRRRLLCMVTTQGWTPYNGDDFESQHTSGLNLREHQILIRIWMQDFDDQTGQTNDTEVTFRTHIENVCNVLERDWALRVIQGSGTAKYSDAASQNVSLTSAIIDRQDLPRGEREAAAGGVPIPCHYAEITYRVVERRLVSPAPY